jgi:hypothetical protein
MSNGKYRRAERCLGIHVFTASQSMIAQQMDYRGSETR